MSNSTKQNKDLMPIQFGPFKCVLAVGCYAENPHRLALYLKDAETWEAVAKCTVNVVMLGLGPDEVAIKDYSENAGMLDALIAQDVVLPPHDYFASGHVRIPICRLTEKAKAYVELQKSK